MSFPILQANQPARGPHRWALMVCCSGKKRPAKVNVRGKKILILFEELSERFSQDPGKKKFLATFQHGGMNIAAHAGGPGAIQEPQRRLVARGAQTKKKVRTPAPCIPAGVQVVPGMHDRRDGTRNDGIFRGRSRSRSTMRCSCVLGQRGRLSLQVLLLS